MELYWIDPELATTELVAAKLAAAVRCQGPQESATKAGT
jgi:hypothetical protein